MAVKRVTMDVRHVHGEAVLVGGEVGKDVMDAGALVLRNAADELAIEGTPEQLLALLERAAAEVRTLMLAGCAKCGEAITDAATANLPTDGSALCWYCGDPDGTPEPGRAAAAVKGESCGQQVGSGHPCALPVDHRWDMHECATDCCSCGSWTDRQTGQVVQPSTARAEQTPE